MADPRGQFQHGYTCQEVVELASEYLEGVMTPVQRTEFELHLNFCDGCFNFVEQVRTTVATAGSVSEEDIPDGVRAQLLEAFRDWGRG